MSENKKYELLKDDTITTSSGKTLYRIKALVAIGLLVAPGDLGGYIENVNNLSVYGDAWVSGDARVYGDARVSGNAWVYGDARVSGNAWVYGDARVYGNAWVYGNARVSGDARVYGNAWVSGDARVYGNAWVYGDAWVSGNAWVYGDALVYGDARVKTRSDIQWFSHVGSEGGTLTVCKAKRGLFVSRGCFSGTLPQFKKAVKAKHGDSKYGRHYAALMQSIEIWFGEEK